MRIKKTITGLESPWRWAVAALVLLLSYLFFVSSRLQIDYFDTFNTYLNAETISRQASQPYSPQRFLAASLLQVPVFFLGRILGIPTLAFRLSHLLAVVIFLAFLFLLFRFYEKYLTRNWAVLGVLFFAFTPVVIHYAPMAKEDLAASFLTTLTFYLYLLGRRQKELLLQIAAGIVGGMAMAMRYNLIPIFVLVFSATELWQGWRHRGLPTRPLLRGYLLAALLPLLFLILVPVLVYPLIHHAAWYDSPALFIRELFSQWERNKVAEKIPLVNLIFLIRILSFPLFFLAAIGLFMTLRRVKEDVFFLAIWFLVVLIYQSYVIPGKEARYLFPLFPPLFYFLVRGIQGIHRVLLRYRALCGFALGVVLLFASARAFQECRKFSDPVYWKPFEKSLSEAAAQLAGTKPIVWIGPFYPLVPRQHVFDMADDYAYVYHFSSLQVFFYTGHGVETWSDPTLVSRGSWEKGVWLPRIGSQVQDGQVLIINPYLIPTVTSNLPRNLPPMLVQRVKWETLASAPDGEYELYTREGSTKNLESHGPIEIKNGQSLTALPVEILSHAPQLLSFDVVKVFYAPGAFVLARAR